MTNVLRNFVQSSPNQALQQMRKADVNVEENLNIIDVSNAVNLIHSRYSTLKAEQFVEVDVEVDIDGHPATSRNSDKRP